MKEELEQIRYNMVCSNNLYCTDRPDLLNENNKEELLFKTDLNESIQLIDKLIEKIEVNSNGYREFKKLKNIYYKIGDYRETLPFTLDNLTEVINKFSTELNESQKEKEELCNEITEKNKMIDELRENVRYTNLENNELCDRLQSKIGELNLVPKKLFYTVNGEHKIKKCEPDTIGLAIESIINEFEEENQKLNKGIKKEEKLFLDTIGEYNKMGTKYDNMKNQNDYMVNVIIITKDKKESHIPT